MSELVLGIHTAVGALEASATHLLQVQPPSMPPACSAGVVPRKPREAALEE